MLRVKKHFQGGGGSAPQAKLHLRTQVVKLDSNCINCGLCLQVGFFIRALSLHFTHFKRRKEEGEKGSSLRVCGFASFMSCDHGCPSLHCICVQIGGEESQNERALAIMCVRVCVPLCEYTNMNTKNTKTLCPFFLHIYTHTHTHLLQFSTAAV